jgi:hypothetical protein
LPFAGVGTGANDSQAVGWRQASKLLSTGKRSIERRPAVRERSHQITDTIRNPAK